MTATASGPTTLDESEVLELVGFRIEGWAFAVRLEQVQTSILLCPVTRVFHVPEYIGGIISLRGTIVGVLDLGRLLGLSAATSAPRRFLVIGADGVQAALPVHDVFRMPPVSADLVDALPPSVTPAQRQYLEGVVNTSSFEGSHEAIRESTLTLIDVEVLFDAPDLRALRGVP